MDKHGREYLPGALVDYVKTQKLERRDIVGFMDLIPFLHKNGLLPFMETIVSISEDTNITSSQMREHFTSLMFRVTQGVGESQFGGHGVTDRSVDSHKASAAASEPASEGPVGNNSSRESKVAGSTNRPALRPSVKKPNALGS
jgi:hypothetical protein